MNQHYTRYLKCLYANGHRYYTQIKNIVNRGMNINQH
ncbi:hypothetical protein Mosig_00030 [Pelagibacter phage Mosig EXVC030M]|nr:hypothetical protein Mosig_00030 [Pelagibacter phage Mosig EXVC030M]